MAAEPRKTNAELVKENELLKRELSELRQTIGETYGPNTQNLDELSYLLTELWRVHTINSHKLRVNGGVELSPRFSVAQLELLHELVDLSSWH